MEIAGGESYVGLRRLLQHSGGVQGAPRDGKALPKQRFTELFRTRTRDEWCAVLEGSDACFAPVLSLSEAAQHAHMKERATFVEVDGVEQPAPAPRFSRTPGAIQGPPVKAGSHTEVALRDWGFTPDEVSQLLLKGAIG